MSRNTTLIAGATGSLGGVLAQHLSDMGHNLVLLGRNEEKLISVRDALVEKTNGKVEIYAFSDVDSISAVATNALRQNPEINGLVSALGAISIKPLSMTSAGAMRQMLEANLISNLELIRSFSLFDIKNIRDRSIVLFSSSAALHGQPGLASYAASKAALESLMRSSALELARLKIRVNAVQLGMLEEGMSGKIANSVGLTNFDLIRSRYPLGLGHCEDACEITEYLLSSKSKWVTGASLAIDGGYSVS